MRRTTRRATAAFRFEALELRQLLSAGPSTSTISDPAETMLVRFAAGVSAAAEQSLIASLHGHDVESFPDGPTVVALDPGTSRSTVLSALASNPEVVYAEPDQVMHVSSILPNDPRFPSQWGLNNANNVDIDAPQAWGVTIGNPSTIVAVIDSGIDLTHAEFAGRLWTNPADGSHGWNFITNTSNVQDDNGHGTHVSGIIAASGNNATGGAGVNWEAQIMPLKFIDSTGNGSTDEAVSAIYWAVAHGARVINASWDGPDYSQSLDDAINYAGSQGVVFVVAAGNESANNDFVPTYPARDRLPNVITVAAVDASGNLANFSNYGASTVDLAAPGVNILSTVPGGYASYSGTSMATPFVAGVVSLVIGLNPNLTAAQVAHQVLSTVKPLPSLAGLTVTGGMVDAFNAVSANRVSINYFQGLPQNNLTLYRLQSAQWTSASAGSSAQLVAPFGQAGVDIPVPGHYDGPGALDYATYRTTTGQWLILGPGGGRVVNFGVPGIDIPEPADYDGDGRTDLAIYRRTTGTWYVIGSRGGSFSLSFGIPSWDQPVPADYDGDGRADLAVFRPNTDQWFIIRSSLGPEVVQFGPPGISDPVPGDYDGDGRADLAVYVPSNASWYIHRSFDGGLTMQPLGPLGATIPAPGDYDGDGRIDPAVYQVSTGQWSVMRSSAGFLTENLGSPALDVPVNAPMPFRLLGTVLDPTLLRIASTTRGAGGSVSAAAVDPTSAAPVPIAGGSGLGTDPYQPTHASSHVHDLALTDVKPLKSRWLREF